MSDINYLKRRFYIFYDYIKQSQGTSFVLEQTKEVFEAALDKKDLKNLANLNKELDVWLREMFNPKEKEELLKILKEELEDNPEANFLNQVKKILERERVESAEEYEILLQRIELIYNTEGSEFEINRINKILSSYKG